MITRDTTNILTSLLWPHSFIDFCFFEIRCGMKTTIRCPEIRKVDGVRARWFTWADPTQAQQKIHIRGKSLAHTRRVIFKVQLIGIYPDTFSPAHSMYDRTLPTLSHTHLPPVTNNITPLNHPSPNINTVYKITLCKEKSERDSKIRWSNHLPQPR